MSLPFPLANKSFLSFNSTYYGKDYRAGAALLRARRPYLLKNALTGFGLFAFSIGVCELAPIRFCLRILPIAFAHATETWSQSQLGHATRPIQLKIEPRAQFPLEIHMLTIAFLCTQTLTQSALSAKRNSPMSKSPTPPRSPNRRRSRPEVSVSPDHGQYTSSTEMAMAWDTVYQVASSTGDGKRWPDAAGHASPPGHQQRSNWGFRSLLGRPYLIALHVLAFIVLYRRICWERFSCIWLSECQYPLFSWQIVTCYIASDPIARI